MSAAADLAVRRLLERVVAHGEDSDAAVSWTRATDDAPIVARPAWPIPLRENRVDMVIGRHTETADELEARAPVDGNWEQVDGYHFAVPVSEAVTLAPLSLAGLEPIARHFERAVADEGTSRDPDTFSAIAANYLRTGPPGVNLEGHEQRSLAATFRGAMDDASHMPTNLDALSELLDALPRDVRGALDFNRNEDAEVIRFGAFLATHRIAPEREALSLFTVGADRETGVDRGLGVGRD